MENTNETYSSPRPPSSLGWPLLLIALGILLLISNLSGRENSFWEVLSVYWPVIMIVMALDGIYRWDGVIGSIVSAGFGVLFLLSNLGQYPLSICEIIFTYWPVFVIAWGLDLIFGRRWETTMGSILPTILALVLLVVIVGGIVWFASLRAGPVGNVQNEAIRQSVDGATRAEYEIAPIAGDLTISAGSDAATLISGDIAIGPRDNLNSNYAVQSGTGRYELKRSGMVWMPTMNQQNSDWNLQISGGLPTYLETDLIAGQTILDLTASQEVELEVDQLVGQTTVSLPATGSFSGKISGLVGKLVIIVPAGVAVEFNVDGFNAIDYPNDYAKDGDVITSPAAQSGGPVQELDLSLLLGQIEIQTAP